MADIAELLSDVELSASLSSEGGYSSADVDEIEGDVFPYQFEPRLKRKADDCTSGSDLETEPEAEVIQTRLGNTEWCTCTKCSIMPTQTECQCCLEQQPIRGKLDEHNAEMGEEISCITDHPGFSAICLNRYVLEVAYLHYRQDFGDFNADDTNERWRYVAYRQLVRWCWGFLGKFVRVPLPACAVSKIRLAFPSPHYRGFQDA